MSASTFCLSFLFVSSLWLQAQKPGDPEFIFEDLDSAKEHPDWVYHLDLSKNKLEEIPQAVYFFKNLKTLDLSRNRISFLPAEIGQLKGLIKLDLSRNKISILPPQMGQLKKLKILYLQKNSIQYLPEELAGLESLEDFNLWANELEKVPREIQQLQQLKVLNLRGMIFDQSEIDKLSEYLPNTRILKPSPCNCKP